MERFTSNSLKVHNMMFLATRTKENIPIDRVNNRNQHPFIFFPKHPKFLSHYHYYLYLQGRDFSVLYLL
jgi:hypothetical protein